MNEKLHRHLDGEIPLEALSADEDAQAEAWHALLGRVRERLPANAPAGLEARVMRSLQERRGLAVRSGVAGLLTWLIRPRPVPVSPLGAALAAAVAAALIVQPWEGPTPSADAVTPVEAPATTRIYVEFILSAPEAASVSVAGNFNDWAPTLLEDVDGDGVWSGRVPVEPGFHEYMFVLDGSTWLTPPNAERYVDDGFGNRNAVLAVAAGA